MKVLKVFFTTCFALFAVCSMNAQFASPCSEAAGNFSMEITYNPLVTGQTCFDVTVNYTHSSPKGTVTPAYSLFVKRLGYVQTSPGPSFSTQVCFPANFPHSESIIYCGIMNDAGMETCRDGCIVTIQPEGP